MKAFLISALGLALTGVGAMAARPAGVAAEPMLTWQLHGAEVAIGVGGAEVARVASPRVQRPDGTNIPSSGLRIDAEGEHEAKLSASFGEAMRVSLALARDDADAPTIILRGVLESGQPVAVSHIALPILLPMSLGQTGGDWSVGGEEAVFPIAFGETVLRDTPSPAAVVVTDGQGRSLRLASSGGTIERAVIQDNRAWNWSVFECQLRFAPREALGPGRPLRFEVRFTGSHDVSQAQAIVDEFGQFRPLAWPGKVTSASELVSDAARERAELEGRLRELAGGGAWDRFGGLAGSAGLAGSSGTGFFEVARANGRDWLLTPEGNLFFSTGVCALTTWDTFTPVSGRERSFAWLPEASSEAWMQTPAGSAVSFYLANLHRKFGDGRARPAFTQFARDRFRAWGFNTLSAFGDRIEGMPYTHWRLREAILAAGSPIPDTSYAGSGSGIIDIFAEDVAERLDRTIGDMVRPLRNDPWMIGYFLGNEEFWDTLPATIASLPATWPSKQRLVRDLEDHYGTVAALRRDFRTDAADWSGVEAAPLWAHNEDGRARLDAFGAAFVDRYFHLVTDAVRRHDPNHLVLGVRLLPRSADAGAWLLEALGRRCDVVSVNYYTDAFEPERVARWRAASGRPLLLSEWSYGAAGRGHTGGPRTVSDQAARAEAYSAYVAAAAASGGVVGCHWFEYLDQPVTGRLNEGDQGERYNVGLVDVTDRPYKELVDAASRANRAVYDVVLSTASEESR